jgi:hypothetical protein
LEKGVDVDGLSGLRCLGAIRKKIMEVDVKLGDSVSVR